MPKNIVLFIDGTWNEPQGDDAAENTNVERLHRAALQDATQRVHYLKGIGTERFPSAFFKLPRPVARLIAGSFGRGMASLVRKAYRILSREYQRDDRIYLFGFSRGAFAVRSLAGFADGVGLLLAHETSRRNVRDAYRHYENQTDPRQSAMKDYLGRLPNPEDRTDLPIYFIGVWDTVAALGLPGRLAWFSAPYTEYHKTELPKNVTEARHALALHELRDDFRPLLWTGKTLADDRQTLEQIWFPGVHSDVGGGYAETDWSKLALDWMASEAVSCHLKLNGLPRTPAAVIPNVPIHSSISGIFARSTPTVRAALSDPSSLAAETSATLHLGRVARRRLLNGLATAYAFPRPEVNDALLDVDELTLRLHLQRNTDLGSPPDEARAAAIGAWWSHPRAAGVSRARGYLEGFTATPSAATTAEREALTEALCLLLVVDDEDGLANVVTSIRTAASHWRLRRLEASEFGAVDAFLTRLSAFTPAARVCEAVGTDAARAHAPALIEVVDTEYKLVFDHFQQAIEHEQRGKTPLDLSLKPRGAEPT